MILLKYIIFMPNTSQTYFVTVRISLPAAPRYHVLGEPAAHLLPLLYARLYLLEALKAVMAAALSLLGVEDPVPFM